MQVDLDERTAREINGNETSYTLEQCTVCAKLYMPRLGHKCERYAPKSREDVIKGIIACMVNGCSSQCPYFIANHNQRELLDGHFSEYSCRQHLANDIKRTFRPEAEEV